MSPFHFNRLFSEGAGRTFWKIVAYCQLELVGKMIQRAVRNGMRPDWENCAARCGFAHHGHMSGRVRKLLDITPTRWFKIAKQVAAAERSKKVLLAPAKAA
jgi:AraC-like DNA-binding protein